MDDREETVARRNVLRVLPSVAESMFPEIPPRPVTGAPLNRGARETVHLSTICFRVVLEGPPSQTVCALAAGLHARAKESCFGKTSPSVCRFVNSVTWGRR